MVQRLVLLRWSSGVPDQPWGDDETMRGAIARARAARTAHDADLGIGIQGWCGGRGRRRRALVRVGRGGGRDGREGIGGSLALRLPERVAQLAGAMR